MPYSLWLRLYTEIIADRKLRRLDPALRWLWIVLLCVAKESPRAGWLLGSDEQPVTVDDLADQAALPVESVDAGLKVFVRQLQLEIVDGTYHVLHWDERQFESDSSRDRMRRLRQRRHGDDDATSLNRHGDDDVTPPEHRAQSADTEHRAQRQSKQQAASEASQDDDPDPAFRRVEARYREVRRVNVVSPADLQAIGRALQVATADQILAAIERVRSRSPTRRPRSFRYYEPVIEEVVQEHATRREIAASRPAGVDPNDPYGGLPVITDPDPDDEPEPGG